MDIWWDPKQGLHCSLLCKSLIYTMHHVLQLQNVHIYICVQLCCITAEVSQVSVMADTESGQRKGQPPGLYVYIYKYIQCWRMQQRELNHWSINRSSYLITVTLTQAHRHSGIRIFSPSVFRSMFGIREVRGDMSYICEWLVDFKVLSIALGISW